MKVSRRISTFFVTSFIFRTSDFNCNELVTRLQRKARGKSLSVFRITFAIFSQRKIRREIQIHGTTNFCQLDTCFVALRYIRDTNVQYRQGLNRTMINALEVTDNKQLSKVTEMMMSPVMSPMIFYIDCNTFLSMLHYIVQSFSRIGTAIAVVHFAHFQSHTSFVPRL